MPIVINRGQYKLPLSFIDLSFISYELQPILDKCRWIIANWWYSVAHCKWKKMLDMKVMFVFKHIDQKPFSYNKNHMNLKLILFLKKWLLVLVL